jgi:TonB family protein
MRNFSVAALFFVLVTSFSSGQQASPTVPVPSADVQPDRVKVYTVGPGVTTPELLPPDPLPIPVEKCKKRINAYVLLSAIIDATGRPRNLMFLKPEGDELDNVAIHTVAADRFKPGTHGDSPVAVGVAVGVSMQACAQKSKDVGGNKIVEFRRISEPVQNLGPLPEPPEEAELASDDTPGSPKSIDEAPLNHVKNGISPPVPLISPEAKFSDAARRAKYQGICLISFIVDQNGLPQDFRVVKPLDYGLTDQSIEAVKRYRFKPAMRNGEPVPVRITVEVNFRLY